MPVAGVTTGTPITEAWGDSVADAITTLEAFATAIQVAATVPTTQAFGDAAAAGSSTHAARLDHRHGMPALGTGATNAAAGNHTHTAAAASGCEVSRASQSIPTASTDAIAFTDADTTDTDAYHSPSTNPSRLVAPFTGRYAVTAMVHHESDTNTSGGRRAYLDKNTAGTHALASMLCTSAGMAGTGGGTGGISLGWSGRLTAGEYVEVFYLQTSGSNRACAAKASMEYLGT